jgi:type I restriction enzyme S subunit
MNEIPEGWSVATLSGLAGNNGMMTDGDWIESKDQDPKGSVRLIQLADIGDGSFLDRSLRFLTEAKAAELRCTFLKQGDLLIARMPDPLGRACIFPGLNQSSVTAVDICIWRTGDQRTDPRWLMYAINSSPVRDRIAALAGGTTRQRVSGGNLKRLEIPTPPFSEQRRIVAKLNSLLARSKSAREELARIPRLVERYNLTYAQNSVLWGIVC